MIEVRIPKHVFEIGDKFLGEYGHENTIIGHPKLESEDYYERGNLIGITFDYVYPIQVDYGDTTGTYLVTESELSKLTRL